MDTKKREAINLLVYSVFKKKEIAEKIGITEPTLYNWLKEDEFCFELEVETEKWKAENQFSYSKRMNNVLETCLSILEERVKAGGISDKLLTYILEKGVIEPDILLLREERIRRRVSFDNQMNII